MERTFALIERHRWGKGVLKRKQTKRSFLIRAETSGFVWTWWCWWDFFIEISIDIQQIKMTQKFLFSEENAKQRKEHAELFYLWDLSQCVCVSVFTKTKERVQQRESKEKQQDRFHRWKYPRCHRDTWGWGWEIFPPVEQRIRSQ